MGKAASARAAGGSGRAVKAVRAAVTSTGSGAIFQAAMDTKGHFSIDRVVERLGMTKQQFGGMIGLSADTLRKSARAAAPKTQERVREAVEILDRVRDWAGGEAQALAWYKSHPIAAFGGRTAEGLVKSGEAAVLRDYLDYIATGGFA